MKRILLIAGIAFSVLGFIAARVGDSLSSVNDSGIVQDSFLMPLGAILFVLGLLALAVALLWFLIGFIYGKAKKYR
jgi:sulfite exporter TauE/SafE